jgi:hypothetical protein
MYLLKKHYIDLFKETHHYENSTFYTSCFLLLHECRQTKVTNLHFSMISIYEYIIAL